MKNHCIPEKSSWIFDIHDLPSQMTNDMNISAARDIDGGTFKSSPKEGFFEVMKEERQNNSESAKKKKLKLNIKQVLQNTPNRNFNPINSEWNILLVIVWTEASDHIVSMLLKLHTSIKLNNYCWVFEYKKITEEFVCLWLIPLIYW